MAWTTASGLTEGPTFPPNTFSAEPARLGESESDGLATDTEGHAVYSSDASDVGFFCDNPFIGSNSFTVNAPPTIQAQTAGDIFQNNVAVTVTLLDKF